MDLNFRSIPNLIFRNDKKSIILHAITDRPDVYEFSKINYANKFYPKWISDMDGYVERELTDFKKPVYNNHNIGSYATIKKCVGINNLYSNGIIIPMWTDFFIDINEKNTNNLFYQFSDKKTKLTVHSNNQFDNQLPNNIFHIKIHSPWQFYCEEDIKFLWTEPTWSLNLDTFDNFKILPAIVDFNYQINTAVNLFFSRKNTVYRSKINFNDPLVHLIPLTERKIVIKYHLLSAEKYHNFRESTGASQQTFVGRYKMNKNHFKTSKCPFLHKEYLK